MTCYLPVRSTYHSQGLSRTFERLVDPLMSAIRRELGAIIAKLHRMNFSDTADPTMAIGGGPSPYMKDLVEKLNFIKTDIISQYDIAEVTQEWSV